MEDLDAAAGPRLTRARQDAVSPRPRRGGIPAPVLTLAALGALWGAGGYAVLWGYTSLVVTRRFVESAAGLATLLPVRVLLSLINLIEDRVVRHPFAFAGNNEWIGIAAAVLGAILVGLPAFLATVLLARARERPDRSSSHHAR